MNNEEEEEFNRKDEFDRKAEFLLNQQAKFDADMRRLEAAQEATQESLKRVNEKVEHLAGFIHEGFGLTLTLFKDTDAKFDALAESQKLTDQKLRDLAALVDRHIREGHKGLEFG